MTVFRLAFVAVLWACLIGAINKPVVSKMMGSVASSRPPTGEEVLLSVVGIGGLSLAILFIWRDQ